MRNACSCVGTAPSTPIAQASSIFARSCTSAPPHGTFFSTPRHRYDASSATTIGDSQLAHSFGMIFSSPTSRLIVELKPLAPSSI